MKQYHLFLAFFRVGILGYGGGPSSIPLVHKEVVEKYSWMDNDEFSDVLALGNTLPGPIATKMAGYIGYRVGGILGMINAIVATIVPTIILMIILLTSLASFKDLAWVGGMTKAVVPVVGVMLAVLTWQFIDNAKKGLGWLKAVILGVASLVLLQVFHVHPGILIAVLLIAALVQKDKKEEPEKKGGTA
ncbi:chromate transporter [Litchfieldia salsa]|uniref:Chromate transporter n=1 Tax=Litchfieldia salsa TaxID=930152 RepID=A0A1H0U2D8_9BACI|nr:chromate transporter [Litchfieldia salsa]SDP60353.1 chromate transporter [Litchfieldia salsa]